MFIKSTIIFLLIIYTVQDVKYKKIHVLYGLIAAALIFAYICLYNISSLTAGALGMLIGIVMYILSMITNEQIGKGDAILLMVTGIGLGFWGNMSFLFLSLMCAACYSIFLIIKNGFKKRQSIPFMPFMLAGYIIFLIMGSV